MLLKFTTRAQPLTVMAQPSAMYVLFVDPQRESSRKALALLPPHAHIQVHNIHKLPTPEPPAWLRGTPLLIATRTREQFAGSRCLHELRRYLDFCHHHPFALAQIPRLRAPTAPPRQDDTKAAASAPPAPAPPTSSEDVVLPQTTVVVSGGEQEPEQEPEDANDKSENPPVGATQATTTSDTVSAEKRPRDQPPSLPQPKRQRRRITRAAARANEAGHSGDER